jgi:hypothetical protein
MTAKILYVLIGLWMIIDKKSSIVSKVKYLTSIISMAGSALLVGFYIAFHIVGFALDRVRTSRIFRLACCCFAGRNSYMLWIYYDTIVK